MKRILLLAILFSFMSCASKNGENKKMSATELLRNPEYIYQDTNFLSLIQSRTQDDIVSITSYRFDSLYFSNNNWVAYIRDSQKFDRLWYGRMEKPFETNIISHITAQIYY